MAVTLKETWDSTRVNQLRERVEQIDRQVISESTQARLIIEAMNDQDLQKAGAVIDKLRALKGKGITTLDTAVDKAIAELNKYTAGGPLAAAWSKIKGKLGVDNPLVKVMTFANALEAGFRQVPAIIKNNVGTPDKDQAQKSISDLVADDPTKKKTVAANLLKALSPRGVFGVFKRVPYVDNMQVFAQDLMTVPLQDLNAIVGTVTKGPQTDTLAADLSTNIKGQGSAETKAAQPAATPVGAQPTTAGAPTKDTTVTTGTAAAGTVPIRPPADIKAKVIARVKPALEDLGIKNVDRVIDTLEDLGVIKAP